MPDFCELTEGRVFSQAEWDAREPFPVNLRKDIVQNELRVELCQ